MIQTVNLTKQYGTFTAVNNLNLCIPDGELFGFLGPNGAGKTTTVKMLTGQVRPTSGTASLNGIDIIRDPINAKRIIGYVPEEPFLYPKLTGREFIQFITDVFALTNKINQDKDRLVNLFGLTEWLDQLIESYSHGMQQKLVLVSVLMRNPEVIILDEPLVGLDPSSARIVKQLLTEKASTGVTVFMCTHILEIAERICQRVGIIEKGRVTALGTIPELKKQTQSTGTLEDVFFHLTQG